MNEKKRKGGAARLRETNKKLLLTAGLKCHNLLNIFSTISEKQKPKNLVSMTKMYVIMSICIFICPQIV